MLILLQPGIEPLGQFDLEDDDVKLAKGGEVAVFKAVDAGETYASDVTSYVSALHLKLDRVATDGVLYGLVDEGVAGYGTSFGQLIGGTVGQGTGFGARAADGVITIGPSTVYGSGKATLWTKPGLYGVTSDAWADSAEFDVLALNDAVYGTAQDGTLDGKLTTDSVGNGQQVAVGLGLSTDTSLVSTTNTAVGLQPAKEHAVVYLLGVQK